MFEDSELKQGGLFHGVGYSPSSYGHEVVDWTPLSVSRTAAQNSVAGSLAQFGASRPGRLATSPSKSPRVSSKSQCASECLKMPSCLSFDFEPNRPICEVFDMIEGANAERKLDGYFVTYERVGLAHTAHLRHENLPLRNGTMYYMNVDVQNVLGYRAVLTSQGTMIDFTPPVPGPIGDAMSDEFTADGCHISILQRCVEAMSSTLNHR